MCQEPIGETLEELWISYNFIEKLKGIEVLKNLKTLYLSYNYVKDWNEFSKISVLHGSLIELSFLGNPLAENMDEEAYRTEVSQRLPFLKRLDGDFVV